MAHYPQNATGLDYAKYPAGSTVTTLTANASANTKGAYAEFVASSDFECNVFEFFSLASNVGVSFLIDIATGAGGAETVVLPDLLFDNSSNLSGQAGSGMYTVPLTIPASTRISGRTQSDSGGSALFPLINLTAAGDTPGPSTYVNYGANTADSSGVQVDPGSSANTKGAYSEVTASTSAVSQVLMQMLTQDGNTVPRDASWLMDIATGAGGAETVLIPDLGASSVLNHSPLPPRSRTLLTYIAASTRIAARAQSGTTDATDRLIDVALLAATAPAEPASGGASAYAFIG